MNERIKELAKQAYIADASRNPNWKFKPETELLLKQLSGFNEKFAEMIVRECIQRCEDIGSDLHARGSYAGDGAFKCAVDLEKHFGVEE